MGVIELTIFKHIILHHFKGYLIVEYQNFEFSLLKKLFDQNIKNTDFRCTSSLPKF